MSQDSPIPDRADKASGDDLDVPTFTPPAAPSASKPTPTDPYKKVGRAAPQEIRPRDPQLEKAAKPEEVEEKQEPSKEAGDRSVPLLSDAPTASFERPDPKPAEVPSEAGGKIPAKRSEDGTENKETRKPAAPVAAPTADAVRVLPEPSSTATLARTEEPSVAYAGASAPVMEDRTEEVEHRRGTLDLGLLLLRCTVGFWLILHSMSEFFHLGDARGLSALEAQYAAYAEPRLLSIVVPSVGLAAGVFLVLGLITPLFAAAAVAVTGFSALDALAHAHAGMDVFSWPDSLWLYVILGGGAAALQFTGPGVYSLDFSRSWARRPLASAWLGAILGVLGAAAAWWFGAGINPLA